MSKNVAVFVDVANIFYAAKAAGVDIDYVTLLKSATAGRDFVRAYAYTGLDPENENQRNFHQFLARNGYKVVSKDIRKYGDGRVKANLDIEMVVDMMKTARNLDVAVLVSGDGDFAPAIRAVQEMGVRVEVICFKANTSSDLIDVADQFLEITQIAKVEKGSGRSGRRVAGDEEDLSMTEVPEKQTEGSTERRRRSRARTGEAAARTERAASRRTKATVTALPGEKLARLEAEPGAEEAVGEKAPEETAPSTTEVTDASAEEVEAGRARRRRRRGRGRGRGREAGPGLEAGEEELEAAVRVPEAPRAPRAAAFGSVWDRQIGVPSGPRQSPQAAHVVDEEEPEIPEYLLAERRGRPAGGRGRGPGRRDAYRSAIERERYGRGGRGPTSHAETREGGRERGREGGRAPRSAEGWSEVPPEIEAMLRAQLAARQPAGARALVPTDVQTARPSTESKPAPRRRATKAVTAEPAPETAEAVAEVKPAPRRRTTKAVTVAAAESGAETTGSADQAKPSRRTRTKAAPTA
jgi:uncharacterized LabA/DUF88 family protein